MRRVYPAQPRGVFGYPDRSVTAAARVKHFAANLS